MAQAQASLRGRILRAFVGRGLLEGFEAQEMLGSKHSGFSVATSVCIAALDRAGLERLLRCCARPAFALDRLRKAGRELIYRCAKQQREPGSGQRDHRNAKRGVKHRAQADELHLTPLELIARLAALVILEHIGVETEPPRITPARGPPLWDECNAQAAEGVEPAPDWDEAAQPAPDFEVDQRISW